MIEALTFACVLGIFWPFMLIATGDRITASTSVSAQAIALSPVAAIANYTLKSTGKAAWTFTTNTVTDREDWILPVANAGNYECMATVVSGTVSSGTTGSWLALSSNRSWTKSRSSLGTNTASISVEIRKVGSSTTLTTIAVAFTATVETGG